MFTLKYNTEISCAHKLPEAYNEKCHNLHGHTYKVLIEIETEELENDVVIDFKLLKDIVDELDHKYLNDYLQSPTTENLAKYIQTLIRKKLEYGKIRITVFESNKSSITYED